MSKTETVVVELGERRYDIIVGDGVLKQAGRLIAPVLYLKRVLVVTDTNVGALHLDTLHAALDAAAIDHQTVSLPPGEKTKDFGNLQNLLDALLDHGIERRTTLVALGGGVVGDLTGFAAAVALRGIDFVQIPTTLLAQVDSSVGGKTGVNSRHGKNLIGAFHQPRLVLADTGILDTLPRRELLAGYAEVVKYGLINDPEFFTWLEEHGTALCRGDAADRRHAIVTSCRAKAAIVAGDERETADRALLNLGHTFGHALEAETGFGDALLHGEAVAIGMVLAFELSTRLGLCPPEDTQRVHRHLAAVGLPTTVGDALGNRWDTDVLIRHMGKDKKVVDGRMTFVLARGIGKAFLTQEVATGDLKSLFEGAQST
ncbi:MAG: 3-dehydroquinate synthase [Alphaproteobacteria bacterium]|nr:3-dehydroquinate synthase [Alphaproteobacteria bacterium]